MPEPAPTDDLLEAATVLPSIDDEVTVTLRFQADPGEVDQDAQWRYALAALGDAQAALANTVGIEVRGGDISLPTFKPYGSRS